MTAVRGRCSRLVYRALIGAYPRAFRARFAQSMIEDFDELVRSTGAFAAWKRAGADLARSIPQQYLRLIAGRARAKWAAPERRFGTPFQSLVQDLRYAWRGLVGAKGFTVVAVTTLALGIGANTAVFSLVHAVLLQPLPFPEPERLVMVWQNDTRKDNPKNTVTPAAFRDFESENEVFASMTSYYTGAATVSGVTDVPERVVVGRVTPSFFEVFGVRPVVGRTFREEDGNPADYRYVVLAHEYWRSRFAADSAVVGRNITVSRVPHVVLGVVPPGIDLPQGASMWTPIPMDERLWANRGSHYLRVIGRLAAGESLQRARANLVALAERKALEYPGSHTGWGVTANQLHTDLVDNIRPALLLLQGAGLVVLLIACVNVANLQLARGNARSGEFGLRTALGAGRWRLVRQVLTESMTLAAIGGVAGIGIGYGVTAALLRLAPAGVVSSESVPLHPVVLLVTLATAVGTGVAFGVYPAWRSASTDVSAAMREGARNTTSSGGRTREALVVVEVGLSLLLLVGAGLLLNSFVRLTNVDPGIETEGILSADVSIPATVYSQPIDRATFFKDLHQTVRQIPGVETAGLVSYLPVTGVQNIWGNGFYRPDLPLPGPGQQPMAILRWVSPEYLATVGLPLLRGRRLTYADTEDTPHAILIDQTMADQFFPGEDPIGKRLVIRYNDWEGEIVGIVGNAKQATLDEPLQPHMYVSFMQTYTDMFLASMTVTLRTAGSPEQLVRPLRDAVLGLDALLVPANVETLEERLAASVAPQRFNLVLVGVFAATAVLLAAIGLYGVIAYLVSRRSRELGLRIALGALERDVLALVLRHGLVLTGTGVLLGLAGVLALSRLLAQFLFGVSATDPVTIGAVALALVTIATLAMLVPARRAAKADPVAALRLE